MLAMEVASDSITSDEMAPQDLMVADVLSLRVFVGLLVGLRNGMLPAYVGHGGGAGLCHVGGDVSRAGFTTVDVLSPRMYVGLLIGLRHAVLPAYNRGDGAVGPHGGGRAQSALFMGLLSSDYATPCSLHTSAMEVALDSVTSEEVALKNTYPARDGTLLLLARPCCANEHNCKRLLNGIYPIYFLIRINIEKYTIINHSLVC
jgi:hypothetical protein